MFNIFRKKKHITTLPFHTDVHCHIMPGVDHGAQTIEDSLAMLRAEMEMGINRVILTSHVTAETFENTPETLAAGFDTLKRAVEEEQLPIELHYSAEYRIDEYWNKEYALGHEIPMPGNFILMENSFQQEMLQLDDLLFDLRVKGYKPILAHPERYSYYSDRKQRLQQIHDTGVKFQVNLLSLAGYFGHGPRETALWMIQNGLVDMLGTDMHNLEHAKVIHDYIASHDWERQAKKLEGHLLNDWVKGPTQKAQH